MSYREYFGGRPLAAELSKAFTVITYDRRGRVESIDTQPYAVEREIEDIETLIDGVGGSAYLYGFSSGAVLALKAAASLSEKVAKLALYEPPSSMGDKAKQDFAQYVQRMNGLLETGNRGMRRSPQWQTMEAVVPTVAYDNAVMGDGTPPVDDAKAAAMPTVVLDGSESLAFMRESASALAKAMPHAKLQILRNPDFPFIIKARRLTIRV
jgi:pimeloyl-ACP methyl ester carboxylesterase